MEYFTITSKASRRAVDCVIVGVYERGKLGAGASDIDAATKGWLPKDAAFDVIGLSAVQYLTILIPISQPLATSPSTRAK